MNNNNKIFFNQNIVETLFPFYFVVDKSFRFIEAGKSLKKICPDLLNNLFSDYFVFKRPFSVDYSFTSIAEYQNQVIILSSKTVSDLLFRGQILFINDTFIFIGSPWLTSPDDLSKFNLNIPDFAIHDAITDMMQLLKTKEIITKDIELLVDSLKKQKGELEFSENELKYSNNRLTVLIQSMQSAILLESSERKIVLLNNAFCNLFHIPVPIDDLIGADCKNAAQQSKGLFNNPELFVDRINSILIEKKIVQNEEIEMIDGTFVERDFIPIFSDNKYHGHLWVYKNISERKRNELELINAKEDAIRVKKTKEQFMANMSHELRNPINIISGMTGLMLDTNLSDTQIDYLGVIKTTSENLLALVNDILDFEKIEAKKIKFNIEPFDLLKCFNEFIFSLKYQAENKNIELEFSFDVNTPKYILGDSLRLKQILLNLINNSLKFTEKGSVKLIVSVDGYSEKLVNLSFEIIDTGIGIPEDQLSNVFKRFAQATNMNENKYGGTGLGLTIVKNLVELQKGTLEVNSKLNIGSSFKVVLPFEKIENINSTKSLEILNHTNLSRVHALVVEDNTFNQLIVKKMLDKYGVKVDLADNGLMAMDLLIANNYDIILLDLQMPVLDGYETINQIRQLKNLLKASIPVIAVTANILSGEKEKCINVGMNDYLSKPFQEQELIAKISKFVNPNKLFSEKIIDLSYVKSIDPSDKTFHVKLIEEFLSQAPELLISINRCFETEDFINLKKHVHKLKGGLSYIGSPLLIATITEIEGYLLNKTDFNLLADLIPKLNKLCSTAIIQLQEELKN